MSEKHEASMNYQAGNTEQEPGSALGLEEFTAQEIAGLVEAQSRFQNGYLSEWPDNYKQLRFARWLYEHRHIEG